MVKNRTVPAFVRDRLASARIVELRRLQLRMRAAVAGAHWDQADHARQRLITLLFTAKRKGERADVRFIGHILDQEGQRLELAQDMPELFGLRPEHGQVVPVARRDDGAQRKLRAAA